MAQAKRKRAKRQLTSQVSLYKGHYPKKSGGLQNWQQSAYYWWWQFLKRNDEYLKCCEKEGKGKLAKLYADFGDVRGNNFWEWWSYREKKGDIARGERLFREAYKPQLKTLANKDEWEDAFNDKSQYLVMAINLNQPRRTQQRRVSDALIKAIEDFGVARKKGRMSLGDLADSTSLYPLHQNFSPYNLEASLACYDAWLANEKAEEKQPQWKLAQYVNSKVATITMSDIVEGVKGDKSDKKTDGRFKASTNLAYRNFMTALFGRYVREAKAMIANTSKGQFPNKVLQK
jgi:hypothetical protein